MSKLAITGDQWFNSQPLKATDLEGKAVLVDFWTYSCINCQRTLPYLKDWWAKYRDKGLIIVGVHTPEFEFEKDPVNVSQALKDWEVNWPVVLDNDYANWDNFNNRYWPAKYLFDQKGQLVYTHFGEGNYRETESEIQKVLTVSGETKNMPSLETPEHEHGRVCFRPTPETYCGYGRGQLNRQDYQPKKVFAYQAPIRPDEDSIALNGKFTANEEYVESAEPGAALLLRFRATEVNLVLKAVGGPATVEIKLAGQPLAKNIKGKDVNDQNEVTITNPTLYNLIKSDDLVEGVLSITVKQGNFQAYAFTFSGCQS